MRELLTAARERFGADAARYKTRQELLEALGLVTGEGAAGEPGSEAPPASAPEALAQPLVVRDFFVLPANAKKLTP